MQVLSSAQENMDVLPSHSGSDEEMGAEGARDIRGDAVEEYAVDLISKAGQFY